MRLQETGKEIWEMMPFLPSFPESQKADCHVFIPSHPLHRSLSTQLAEIPKGGSSVCFGALLPSTSLITKASEVREHP